MTLTHLLFLLCLLLLAFLFGRGCGGRDGSIVVAVIHILKFPLFGLLGLFLCLLLGLQLLVGHAQRFGLGAEFFLLLGLASFLVGIGHFFEG